MSHGAKVRGSLIMSIPTAMFVKPIKIAAIVTRAVETTRGIEALL